MAAHPPPPRPSTFHTQQPSRNRVRSPSPNDSFSSNPSTASTPGPSSKHRPNNHQATDGNSDNDNDDNDNDDNDNDNDDNDNDNDSGSDSDSDRDNETEAETPHLVRSHDYLPPLPPRLHTSLNNALFLLNTSLRSLQSLLPNLRGPTEQEAHHRVLLALGMRRDQLLRDMRELVGLYREMTDLSETVEERCRQERAEIEWRWRVRASRRALGLPEEEGEEVQSLTSEEE